MKFDLGLLMFSGDVGNNPNNKVDLTARIKTLQTRIDSKCSISSGTLAMTYSDGSSETVAIPHYTVDETTAMLNTIISNLNNIVSTLST